MNYTFNADNLKMVFNSLEETYLSVAGMTDFAAEQCLKLSNIVKSEDSGLAACWTNTQKRYNNISFAISKVIKEIKRLYDEYADKTVMNEAETAEAITSIEKALSDVDALVGVGYASGGGASSGQASTSGAYSTPGGNSGTTVYGEPNRPTNGIVSDSPAYPISE